MFLKDEQLTNEQFIKQRQDKIAAKAKVLRDEATRRNRLMDAISGKLLDPHKEQKGTNYGVNRKPSRLKRRVNRKKRMNALMGL